MHKIMRSQAGFTLVELMIGIMTTVILLGAVSGLLSTSLKSWQTGGSKVEAQQTARIALDAMVRDLRYARQISVAADGKSITLTTADGQNIKFQLGNTSGNPNTLYRVFTASSTYNPITENVVNSLSFTKDYKSITININVQDSSGGTTAATKVVCANIP